MTSEVVDYQFAGIDVRPRTMEVLKAGRALSLEPKSFRVLVYLIEHRDRVVSKDELFQAVWAGTAVTDNALTRVIAQLRRELGDDARQPRFIQTVPTLGYRFVGQIEAVTPIADPAVLPHSSFSWRYLVLAMTVAVALGSIIVQRQSASIPGGARVTTQTQFTTSPGLDLSATFSPDGRSVAFCSDRTGRFQIYVRPLDSTDQELQLTDDEGQNIQPAWSPDGRSIAYHSVSRGGIWIMASTGGRARLVAPVGSQPRWAPNSQSLVFRSDNAYSVTANDAMSAAPSFIKVVKSDGSGEHVVAQGKPRGRYLFPSWSPDGRSILFATFEGKASGLWIMAQDGSNPRKIAGREQHLYMNPIYAPDGRRVFYASTSKAKDFGIWQVGLQADGTAGEPVEVIRTGTSLPRDLAFSLDGRRLTYTLAQQTSTLWSMPPGGTPAPLYKDVVFRTSFPAFSPDGKRIAFFAQVFGGQGDIWVMNGDGTGARPLTSNKEPDLAPSWTPDGSSVVYTRHTGSGAQFWRASVNDHSERPFMDGHQVPGWPRLSPDGMEVVYHVVRERVPNIWTRTLGTGEVRQLTHDTEGAGYPAWSADGKQIAYQLLRGGHSYLAVMRRDGGEQTQLNSDPGHSWAFGWSPDSKKVLFAGFRNAAWNIWALDRNSGEQQRLTDYTSMASYVRYPVWSPDGSRIVFEYGTMRGNIFMLELQAE